MSGIRPGCEWGEASGCRQQQALGRQQRGAGMACWAALMSCGPAMRHGRIAGKALGGLQGVTLRAWRGRLSRASPAPIAAGDRRSHAPPRRLPHPIATLGPPPLHGPIRRSAELSGLSRTVQSWRPSRRTTARCRARRRASSGSWPSSMRRAAACGLLGALFTTLGMGPSGGARRARGWPAPRLAAPPPLLAAARRLRLTPPSAPPPALAAAQTKQYKKGIKNADAILKKFPDHGETLAMKVRGARQRRSASRLPGHIRAGTCCRSWPHALRGGAQRALRIVAHTCRTPMLLGSSPPPPPAAARAPLSRACCSTAWSAKRRRTTW